MKFLVAETAADYAIARMLFEEYAAAIKIDLCFQKFDDELSNLESMYRSPYGGIILAEEQGDFKGCVGIRRIDDSTGELKRMYVRSGHQQKGVGKQLLLQAINLAKACNYKMVRLDTLSTMEAAIRLYKTNGFYETESYYPNPITTALYFEKRL